MMKIQRFVNWLKSKRDSLLVKTRESRSIQCLGRLLSNYELIWNILKVIVYCTTGSLLLLLL